MVCPKTGSEGKLYLEDDGTLDTVLQCSECGEELRYNYSAGEDDGTYGDFVAWAKEDAAEQHENDVE